MTNPGLAAAQRLLEQAVNALAAVVGSGDNTELVSTLTTCESAARRLERVVVDAVAALDRRGGFTERGYKSATQALTDLLGCERFEAHRRVAAAEQVSPRTGLDGATLPAAARHRRRVHTRPGGFAARRGDHPAAQQRCGRAALARSLGRRGGAARRLGGPVHPRELHEWGKALVEALDQDGAEPDDRPPARVNELFLSRLPDGGGKIKGRFDDAERLDAVATAIDALAAPRSADEQRTPPERQADALAEICGYALGHAPTSLLPDTGGRRPVPTC